MIDFEFYETPAPFTRWLFREMAHVRPINGLVFDCCAGDNAILTAADLHEREFGVPTRWITNDLDERWPSEYHRDAREEGVWTMAQAHHGPIDWTVSNPPFTPALAIIEQAIAYSRVGVAMHLRASIHEVLKTGERRTWMNRFPPTGILWLPRFAYQRSKSTGDWTTDSVCACWVVWLKDRQAPQFIKYAPEWVIDELAAFTPGYRSRMDQIMATRRMEQTA